MWFLADSASQIEREEVKVLSFVLCCEWTPFPPFKKRLSKDCCFYSSFWSPE